jgi:Protein of unknown function, DUF488
LRNKLRAACGANSFVSNLRGFLSLMPAAWRYRSSRSGIPRIQSANLLMLAASQVGLVVDVRAIPRSRTNPQFNREALLESLSGSQIAYEHVVELARISHTK